MSHIWVDAIWFVERLAHSLPNSRIPLSNWLCNYVIIALEPEKEYTEITFLHQINCRHIK